MNIKLISISLIVTAILVSGAIIVFNSGDDSLSSEDNVSMVDGKQIITITAKGGYYPRITNAKAGVPTIIRMMTQSSFDCSSSVVIRDIGYRGNLPQTGQTDIEVSAEKATGTMQGLCSMGMYGFQIRFN